jgi:hypothetical protein
MYRIPIGINAVVRKIKLSPQQAMEAYTAVRF